MNSELREKALRLQAELNQVIRGKEKTVRLLVTAVAAGGSVLLEDVPGVGKTTLVRALAKAVRADFRRIQFTPDLLPGDILGGSIYNPVSGEFSFREGPIFTNLLLADEINRASARTQSALLEAMSEKQISMEGRTLALPKPFWVLATENPVEYQGTYALPEAQLDRFAMKLGFGYPSEEAELQLLHDRLHGDPMNRVEAVMECADVAALQEAVLSVELNESCAVYLRRIVAATRTTAKLKLGASPRALLDFCRLAQAAAFLDGRDAVAPDDVKMLAPYVLSHRLIPAERGVSDSRIAGEIVAELLTTIKVPR